MLPNQYPLHTPLTESNGRTGAQQIYMFDFRRSCQMLAGKTNPEEVSAHESESRPQMHYSPRLIEHPSCLRHDPIYNPSHRLKLLIQRVLKIGM